MSWLQISYLASCSSYSKHTLKPCSYALSRFTHPNFTLKVPVPVPVVLLFPLQFNLHKIQLIFELVESIEKFNQFLKLIEIVDQFLN